MQLTVQRVFDATLVLASIINEKRPMTQLGKFRVARLHAKLLPEFNTANATRDELIAKHGQLNEATGQTTVPVEHMAEFNAEWLPIAQSTIEIDIEPIPIGCFLDIDGNGSIEAAELQLLGDLVVE